MRNLPAMCNVKKSRLILVQEMGTFTSKIIFLLDESVKKRKEEMRRSGWVDRVMVRLQIVAGVHK